MALKKVLCCIFILLGLNVGACARQKEGGEPSMSPRKSSEPKETSPSLQEAKDGEKRLMEELIDKIGVIEEYTPELFVYLTILYKKETARWIAESSALPDAQQQHYIEEENKHFFERFGTTEEEYIRYSTEHWEELDSYIEVHPEFMSALKEE
jgi:hypothetical protein